MKYTLYWLLFLCLLLAACGKLEAGIENPTATPVLAQTIDAAVETAVSAALPTAIVQITATPVGTETAVPTLPATPTATPPPASTSTLTPTPTATRRPIQPTQPPNPQILSFTASPLEPPPGGSLFLSWQAVGETASLCVVTSWQVTFSCTTVPLQDAITFPLDATLRTPFTLELRVQGNGQEVTTVNYISIICHASEWFFDVPPVTCPSDTPTTTNAAFEQFERGFMLWLEDSDTIYVFFESPNHPVMMFYEPLYFVTPAAPVTDEPPDGFYAPTSGFGHIWRGEVLGSENVRDWLGWATEPEHNFTATHQQVNYDYNTLFYLSLPNGRILQVDLTYGNWYEW